MRFEFRSILSTLEQHPLTAPPFLHPAKMSMAMLVVILLGMCWETDQQVIGRGIGHACDPDAVA